MGYFINLETLFNTDRFYMIQSNANGREICRGTFAGTITLETEDNLKAALEFAIKDRIESGNGNPILIYPDVPNKTKLPLYALTVSGEYKTFEQGYYARPLEKATIKEILKSYANQEVEPMEFENYLETKIDRFDDVYNNLKAVLGTDKFYLISGCCIQKYNPDTIKQINAEKNIRDSIRLIVQDKKKTGNNYPIAMINDSKSCIIDSEDVKLLDRGYYLPINEPITDTDAVIKHIYDIEMNAYMEPKSQGQTTI